MVSVEAFSLSYRGRFVLRDVELGVPSGQLCLLTGPSGSGKSSLVMSMAGLLPPTAGKVQVGGVSLYQGSEARRDRVRRQEIGLVTQTGDLVPELTIGENVALPLRVLGIDRRSSTERALATLASFGVADLYRSSVHQVSGGQWQRAAIARALVHRPRLVLADELTASLDEANAISVVEQLRAYALRERATVVVASHDLRFADWADSAYRVVGEHLEAARPLDP